MRTAVVLFTRDLHVHDHRGLSEAARTYDRVVPLSPSRQAHQFDPDGDYVRRYVPELPTTEIHAHTS
jgi:deoxyribodipyrimidine photolyase